MFKRQFSQNKPKGRKPGPPHRPIKPGELVDPVLYVGGLEESKYPRLSQKEDDNLKTKEVENPLNKRI